MAPEIKPGIRFIEHHSGINQTLGDVPGHTQKAIAFRCIHRTGQAFCTGAFDDPIGDLIGQLSGLGIQGVSQEAIRCQCLKYLKGLRTASDAQNALEANDTACPHTGCYRVDMARILGIALSEGSAGGQLGPLCHQTLAHMGIIPGQLDPLILAQALHMAFLLFK